VDKPSSSAASFCCIVSASAVCPHSRTRSVRENVWARTEQGQESSVRLRAEKEHARAGERVRERFVCVRMVFLQKGGHR